MHPENENEALLQEEIAPALARGIDPYVLPVLVIMVIGFLFFLPKIYIANNIYLTSLKLERSQTSLLILQDENQQLRREVESDSFKMENP